MQTDLRENQPHPLSQNSCLTASQIWSPSTSLSDRIQRLREEFWQFYEREVTNEAKGYTTGTKWDSVYSIWSWTNVPEVAMFQKGFRSYLLAGATKVELPDGFWDQPLVLRQALFFREVLRKYMPIRVLEGELIVGFDFNSALSRCLTKKESRKRDREEQKFLKEWSLLNDLGIGNCAAVPGHLVPDYPKVLEIGWKGIQEEAQAVANDPSSTNDQRSLARAIVISADGVRALMERYQNHLSEMADHETDLKRKAELKQMADMWSKVPWLPPENFPEALQSLWTTHMLVMTAESYPGPGISPGRVDQYLYPFYQMDVENGKLTREQAMEWLECWWIKHNYAYDYQGWTGTNQGINSSFGQLITLAGIDEQGNDAANELTYLMLDVIEAINLLEPKPNVRLHTNSADRLLRRLVEMLANSQGSPFLINFDENSMAGLRWEGVPERRLWDYAPVGCLENTLVGDDRSGTVDVNLNLAKAIEFTLFNGVEITTGKQIGPKTGEATQFQSFEDFFQAFKNQLRFLIDWMVRVNNIADGGRAEFEPVPYLSALVGGCLESGKDCNAGGAHYNFLTIEGVALATVVDSLAAVKKLVYEEHLIEMPDLLQAIKANYEGFESLRQMLLNKAPKFGNDDPYADQIATEVNRFWTEETFKYLSSTGKRYRAGYLSWNYWIAYAPSTAATPDGRMRGKFLSNAVCPVNGADRKGPTSVIKSVGHLGLESVPNGASHTMSFSPNLMRTSEGREKFMALLRAYGKVGGTCLQINMIEADTLRNAQANPEDYHNLLVRVTGYNAYFTGLGKEIQDEIIARESHQF